MLTRSQTIFPCRCFQELAFCPFRQRSGHRNANKSAGDYFLLPRWRVESRHVYLCTHPRSGVKEHTRRNYGRREAAGICSARRVNSVTVFPFTGRKTHKFENAGCSFSSRPLENTWQPPEMLVLQDSLFWCVLTLVLWINANMQAKRFILWC